MKKFFTVLLLGALSGALAQTGGVTGGMEMTGGMTGGAPTVEGTIELFDEGIAEVPLSAALSNIRGWEETLRAAGSDDLTMIADNLAQLSEALQADSVDTTAAAGLLSQLGDETRAAAQGADSDTADQLMILASLLTQVGQQLMGDVTPEGDATLGTPEMTGGVTGGAGDND